MTTLKTWNVLVELIKTKTGAILHKINLSDNHFFLEQNPLKDSKYGVAYRELKLKYPEFYMFWEIKDNEYTGKVLTARITDKKELDKFIEELVGDNFKNYEDFN
ncbi:hypothetical protein FE773_05080 [Caminibacter mediatlanticus TB-2]|uniref:Uncharacterized protein n=1 Tax=Caminibacter mediatlanticus TB-2 TaxID=391592 RepID=A0AAI9AG71_9BACT|nr:hypothetical protein [Caminibacter mediatlanticus]EDM23052.1 hypothetical protein CMTB2_00369 [Caminibacter mediatlanticus TB-2]QCT94569.1 hypothetical protein FE773_05080 [Caminibacter mediatlanticus TB-2]